MPSRKRSECAICITQEELDVILGKRPTTRKTTAKATTASKRKKAPTKVSKTRRTTAKATTASKRKKAPTKVSKTRRTTAKAKAKAKSKSASSSNSSNAVSVSVNANPRAKAVSNIYIVNPPERRVVDAPRKDRHISYDAPLLPKRIEGSNTRLSYPSSRPRVERVYVKEQAPMIITEQREPRQSRRARAAKREAPMNTIYDVDYPIAIEATKRSRVDAPSVKALPAPKTIDADYTIVPDRKRRRWSD